MTSYLTINGNYHVYRYHLLHITYTTIGRDRYGTHYKVLTGEMQHNTGSLSQQWFAKERPDMYVIKLFNLLYSVYIFILIGKLRKLFLCEPFRVKRLHTTRPVYIYYEVYHRNRHHYVVFFKSAATCNSSHKLREDHGVKCSCFSCLIIISVYHRSTTIP